MSLESCNCLKISCPLGLVRIVDSPSMLGYTLHPLFELLRPRGDTGAKALLTEIERLETGLRARRTYLGMTGGDRETEWPHSTSKWVRRM